jgi:DNA adenine methylase
MKIRHPALRYFGGKWRLAAWIISHFPAHTCYVEPFGGAMSVLLQKAPATFDIYNDLDGEVVNFFSVLRDHTEDLVRAIQLTPFSRAELERAYQPCTNDLEQARRLYIRSYQSIGGPRTQWRTGWRFQKTDSRGKRSIDDWKDQSHLYAVAQRLRGIYLECDDFANILERYDTPGTLFYLDPPYVQHTRSKRWHRTSYTHELSDKDHQHLADLLKDIKGMALVSGYPSQLYDELYAGWRRVQTQARTNSGLKGAKLATECLWISPNCERVMPQKALALFEPSTR